MSEAEGLSRLNVCITFYTHLSKLNVSYCVPHTFEPHEGAISEAKGLSQLNDCIVFCMRLSGNRVPEARPSAVSTQCLYCVLHAISHQDGSLQGWPGLNLLGRGMFWA